MTGLSGAGKSTLARAAQEQLAADGFRVLVLDGDDMRQVIGRGLGFGLADVIENNSRVAHHVQSHRNEVDVLIVPIISPYPEGRSRARAILAPGFFEIYVTAELETVMTRDPKGLYARALAGEVADMIGISPEHPYVPPLAPDLVLGTDRDDLHQSSRGLVTFIRSEVSRCGSAAAC